MNSVPEINIISAAFDPNSDQNLGDTECILDDDLLEDVGNDVTILDSFEEEQVKGAICTRCRTISNSFLGASSFQSKVLPKLSVGSIPNGAESSERARARIYIQPSDPSQGDEAPLISAFDDEMDHENRRDFGAANGPDHCHPAKPKQKASKAVTKLIIACILTTIFLTAEVVGGWLANSLAIMSDAAHLLSDLTSFMVSLVAIYLSSRPASKRMNYGYQRAEVLGAVISVLIIWLITGVLVYIAIERIVSMKFEVDADTMIIVSALGVVINIVLGMVLHTGHGHGHSHGGRIPDQSHDVTDTNNNINLRAAFIHVLGDLIQSIGVLIAAYIIRYYPAYKIADPICTFLFSVIVVFTTIPILKDLAIVLMEGTPPGTDYSMICAHLAAIPGVKMVHSLHLWALTLDKNALSVHLAIGDDSDPESVLKDAQRVVRYRHRIGHTTIQVERYQPLLMDNCLQCQPLTS